MAKSKFVTKINNKRIAAHQATYAEKDAYGNSITLGFDDSGKVATIGGKEIAGTGGSGLPVSETANSVLFTEQAEGTPEWAEFTSKPFGTQVLDDEGNQVLDEEEAPIYDDENTVELWASFNDKEFGAKRAYEDHLGNNIAETYVKTDDLSGKADKVSSATEGNLASLDATGNFVDSGVSSGVLTSKVAADGGTDLSLVTTGEKYVWNDWTSASVNIPPINGVKIGGRKYEVKKFGDRVWMMESLKYDTDVSEAVHINNGIYYYKNEYVFTNAEFAALLPAGWRVPTQADREAFIQNAGGTNVTGANYVKNNFNVEPSGMYNGYGTYPGSFSSYPFYIMTDGNSGSYAGAIYLTSDTPSELRGSGNAGGNGNQISAPVRLCRDALQGE